MFYIYLLQNKLNSKIYVGKGTDPINRFSQHKTVARKGKEKYGSKFRSIHAALKKYGVENFKFLIIEDWVLEEDAYEAEKFWIEFFRSKIEGYNETVGGEGFLSGPNNPMYGKHPSEYTLKLLSECRRGELNCNFGKIFSPETIRKMSESKIGLYSGQDNPNSKITNEQAVEIRKLFDDNLFSRKELCIKYDMSKSAIDKILRKATFK
jgi:predicted GIY-YIG superfamily endonuclease